MLSKYVATGDFLEHSQFRFSQPGALNDRYEALPKLVIEEYSDEDWEVARAQASASGLPSPKESELEALFLRPFPARRFDEKSFPGLWPAREPRLRPAPFASLAEFDVAVAERLIELILKEANKSVAVFCLTSEPSEAMFAYYGDGGSGLRVDFDENHPFFKGRTRRVEYRERVAVSIRDGVVRFAGRTLQTEEVLNGRIGMWSPDLFFRKAEGWSHEQEVRMLDELNAASRVLDKRDRRGFPIHLFDVPSEAVLGIVLGEDVSAEALAGVAAAVRLPRWKHLFVSQRKLTHRGVEEFPWLSAQNRK